MKDETENPYLSFQEWKSSRSTFAINPGASSMIRGMEDVCKGCKTGPHKQLVDGQCEWCLAGGYISESDNQ